MPFKNNASELRARANRLHYVKTVDAPSLWEELANINAGIAEILEKTKYTEPRFS